jgi:hypothetical protein
MLTESQREGEFREEEIPAKEKDGAVAMHQSPVWCLELSQNKVQRGRGQMGEVDSVHRGH